MNFVQNDPRVFLKTQRNNQVYLFLQGPNCHYFRMLADALEARGHTILRLNLCAGDWYFWRRSGAENYRGRMEDWPRFIENYLLENKVTIILLIGEQRYYHKQAIVIAKRHKIRVFVTDFGYLRPDWITLEENGMSGESLFPRNPDKIKTLALQYPMPNLEQKYHNSFWAMAGWEILYHVITILGKPLYPWFKWHHVHHPLLSYVTTGLRLLHGPLSNKYAAALVKRLHDENIDYFVYPLQMQNDFQLRAYSKYENQQSAIEEIVKSFAIYADANSHLVIKIHPWDPGLDNWGKFINICAGTYGVRNRVHFIDGGSLGDLFIKTKGVVTINSTAGLSALINNSPLITLGEAIFNIDGLTFQGSLNDFWNKASPPDRNLLRAYLRALTGLIQLRGVYYNKEGLRNAVDESVVLLEKTTDVSV